jgi:eukaryotic-like serine/threonine-protein kinase
MATAPLLSGYRFGPFLLDLRSGDLTRNGRRIRLQEKSRSLLVAFAEHPGEVITRAEMHERLWPGDTFVDFEDGLNTAMSKLRDALDDNRQSPRYIETVRGRGYRFIAEVAPVAAENGSQVHAADADGARPGATSAESAKLPLFALPVLLPETQGPVRPRRRLLAASVLVGCLALAGGAILYRTLHAKLPLTGRDTIVLTDFANETGDPVFNDSLKQAFAIELGQSPFLNVLSDQQVSEDLKIMERPSNTPITEDVGREICQRSGSTALLSGNISRLGTDYVLNLNAIACSTGESLGREQGVATNKEGVLAALNRATSSLRTRLGESLPSVQKFEKPIEATTSSLEALNSYTMGIRIRNEKGDEASIPFLQRAIELDPNFPMAYAELAVTYANLFQQSLAIENATKAYQLRDRATEREKLRISATYFRMTGQMEEAAAAYQLWIANYPRDITPYVRLSVTYADLGQYEMASETYQEALRVSPDQGHLYGNLGEMYISLNRLSDAKATFDEAVARKLDDDDLHEYLYLWAFLQRDNAEMEQQVNQAAGKPGVEDEMLSTQSDTEAYYGRLHAARELSRKAVDSALRANDKEAAAYWQVNSALREAETGNFFLAREEVAEALALSRGKDVKIVAALTLARTGDPRADAIARELKQSFPTNTLLKVYWLPTIAAALAVRQGHYSEAIAELQAAEPNEMGVAGMFVNYLYPAYIRGEAYLGVRNGSAAAAEFQKLLDHPGVVTNFVTGALAHLQIARAYAESGDRIAAMQAYQDFFALRKHADPDLPMVRQAKAEYSKLRLPVVDRGQSADMQ